MKVTLTVYGPPGRIPWIEYRPWLFAEAPYRVPEGTWVATIVAPGNGWPSSSVILPVRVEVVTWAIMVAVPMNRDNSMRVNFSFRIVE